MEMTDYQKHQLYLATLIYDKYVASDDIDYKNLYNYHIIFS